MNIQDIEAQALKEVSEETFRDRVNARKAVLRERIERPWWKRLLPFRIHIERI